jgi:serine/threonine-protein kinase
MADVFEAVDTRLGRPVAVKILRPEMAARPDVRRRFEDEARAAASLSHPNVVAVFDTGDDGGTPWIVMERLSGETLAHRMAAADSPLDTEWTLRMAGDVLLALRAAHAAGIVHRDVKPGNILFSDEGCAKVADFGIAKSVEGVGDATTAGLLIGTPRYLSPERIEGRATTASSDLYAMGVILYEALAGRPAFEGDTPVATAFAVQHTTPVPLAELRPELSPAIADVVERAMRRDTAERFATAAEMGEAVEAARTLDLREAPDTVVVPMAADAGHDDTVTIARPATAVPAPAPAIPARLRQARIGDRNLANLVPVLVVAGLILVLLAFLATTRSTGGDGGSEAAATGPTNPASPLTTELRNVAARVDDPAHDGPAGPQAAAGLRSIADKLDAGQQAGADATALARQVATWHQQRQLFDTASSISLAVLAKVPGVDMAAAQAGAAPAPAATPKPGKGEKKKKGDD